MKRGRKGKRHKTTRSWTRLGHGVGVDIPLELTIEILKNLPAKSLMRFQCVSKLWLSIISSNRDFIESILTRSSTQPPCDVYLLSYYRAEYSMECSLVLSSTTFPRNAYKPILSAYAKSCQYMCGLLLCWSDVPTVAAIYNLTTRQSLYLPKMNTSRMGTYFFGYDPLEDQYKVLFLPSSSKEQSCQVFTLGDPTNYKTPWRTIQGFRSHSPLHGAVCMDGVIYYRANNTKDNSASKYILMSFDVKSEEFSLVDAPKTLMEHASALINYQGKLGFICWQKRMEIWVREDCDGKTQGWSKIFFYEMDGFGREWRVTGANRGGDILLINSKHYLCVFYYDPKRNSMRYVDLSYPRVRSRHVFFRTFPDYMENTRRLF